MSEGKKDAVAVPGKNAEAYSVYRNVGEVVIEIGNVQNQNFMWPPTRQNLRGAYKKANLVGISQAAVMSQMPDLPGMYIVFDGKQRQSRIADPLEADSNKEVLRAIQRVHKEAFRTEAGPERSVTQKDLTLTKMKTLLYWMRRFVDAEQARVIAGTLPTAEEIEVLPGQIEAESWNSSALARKFRDETEDSVAERQSRK